MEKCTNRNGLNYTEKTKCRVVNLSKVINVGSNQFCLSESLRSWYLKGLIKGFFFVFQLGKEVNIIIFNPS